MKKIFLILLIIMFCTGCTSTSEGVRRYQECYYGDNDEEVCVSKYVPEDPDVDQWYGW